jgi:hypothetical protein
MNVGNLLGPALGGLTNSPRSGSDSGTLSEPCCAVSQTSPGNGYDLDYVYITDRILGALNCELTVPRLQKMRGNPHQSFMYSGGLPDIGADISTPSTKKCKAVGKVPPKYVWGMQGACHKPQVCALTLASLRHPSIAILGFLQ